jgi:YfiH family protein
MGWLKIIIERINPVSFHQVGSIKYFTFPSLENQRLYHAVFTRQGGVSPNPWKSLNFGASVGDDITRVRINRETAFASVGIRIDSVYDVYQIHSSEIISTGRPLLLDEPHIKADAIVTNQPFVTLLMRFADCVPIMLFDPVNRAIGIAHAGWIGTIDKIAKKTVIRMEENYGTDPTDILATIGPSIGPDHYSIRNDVMEKVISSFKDQADQLLIHANGKTYFDLWKANQINLSEMYQLQYERLVFSSRREWKNRPVWCGDRSFPIRSYRG